MPEQNPKEHDEFYSDLHPEPEAGINVQGVSPHPGKSGHTAYDVKDAYDLLPGFHDSDLRRIPILPAGSRLLQGATYIDLRDPKRREFTASAQTVAGDDNLYVPKDDVDYQLWNRLIGVKNPERTGNADEA